MTLYRILTYLNLALLLAGIYTMLRIIILWITPKAFSAFYYYLFLVTLLFAVGQCYTIVYPGKGSWQIKLGVTLYGIMVFSFLRAIKKYSIKK